MKNSEARPGRADSSTVVQSRRLPWKDLQISVAGKGSSREFVERLLKPTGLRINGPAPWDVKVNDPRLFDRVLSEGSLGLGDSYIEGWWDCDALDEMGHRLLRAKLDDRVWSWQDVYLYMKARITNRQTFSRSGVVAKRHYDIGNDLYERMLDARMIYSCAYWRQARNLDEAQEAKLDLVCQKLDLRPEMKVLDIGCGWGGFLKFAAERYGVQGTGITVSATQAEQAQRTCAGWPVEIKLTDYRELEGTYDRIVSIGMFEHVGYKNYRRFFKACNDLLSDGGLLLLHSIGGNKTVYNTEPWIEKHIFPNGMLPSVRQIGESSEEWFVMEDWHNFGTDYDKTLMAWANNFDVAWPDFRTEYGERFYRTWRYYLLMCAGSFRARKNQLWQIVFAKEPRNSYASIR